MREYILRISRRFIHGHLLHLNLLSINTLQPPSAVDVTAVGLVGGGRAVETEVLVVVGMSARWRWRWR
jgi:hypothetical protein